MPTVNPADAWSGSLIAPRAPATFVRCAVRSDQVHVSRKSDRSIERLTILLSCHVLPTLVMVALLISANMGYLAGEVKQNPRLSSPQSGMDESEISVWCDSPEPKRIRRRKRRTSVFSNAKVTSNNTSHHDFSPTAAAAFSPDAIAPSLQSSSRQVSQWDEAAHSECPIRSTLTKSGEHLKRHHARLCMRVRLFDSTGQFGSLNLSETCPRPKQSASIWRQLGKDGSAAISSPFHFQHITHTHPLQFDNLDGGSREDLITEFAAIRASQRPKPELQGIQAHELHYPKTLDPKPLRRDIAHRESIQTVSANADRRISLLPPTTSTRFSSDRRICRSHDVANFSRPRTCSPLSQAVRSTPSPTHPSPDHPPPPYCHPSSPAAEKESSLNRCVAGDPAPPKTDHHRSKPLGPALGQAVKHDEKYQRSDRPSIKSPALKVETDSIRTIKRNPGPRRVPSMVPPSSRVSLIFSSSAAPAYSSQDIDSAGPIDSQRSLFAQDTADSHQADWGQRTFFFETDDDAGTGGRPDETLSAAPSDPITHSERVTVGSQMQPWRGATAVDVDVATRPSSHHWGDNSPLDGAEPSAAKVGRVRRRLDQAHLWPLKSGKTSGQVHIVSGNLDGADDLSLDRQGNGEDDVDSVVELYSPSEPISPADSSRCEEFGPALSESFSVGSMLSSAASTLPTDQSTSSLVSVPELVFSQQRVGEHLSADHLPRRVNVDLASCRAPTGAPRTSPSRRRDAQPIPVAPPIPCLPPTFSIATSFRNHEQRDTKRAHLVRVNHARDPRSSNR